MEIRFNDCRLWVDGPGVVRFEGTLRLHPRDYEPVWTFLMQVLEEKVDVLTLDLRPLVFVNSSGINALYKLAVELRKRGTPRLVVEAGDGAWQKKSLPNLKRFLPSVELRLAG